MKRFVLSVLALAISAGAATEATTSPQLPVNAYRITLDRASSLFDQCSRDAPTLDGAAFEPETADILRLETQLVAILSGHSDTDGIDPALRFTSDPKSYARQYAGYRLAGRPMIYGNFLPMSDHLDGKALATEALIVCDGGPSFFGVEYDVERQTVTRVAFNGGLGGPLLAPIEP